MKKMSFWAKDNPALARTIIILSKLSLAFIAWNAGNQLTEIDLSIPGLITASSILILLIAIYFYPKREGMKFSYWKRKAFDFTLVASTFILIVSLTNQLQYSKTFTSVVASSYISVNQKPTAEEILESLKYRDKNSLTRHEKKILKKEFGRQIKIYASAKLHGNKKEGDKAGLIILTIIGAIGLALVVTALACSVGCGGSEGLAAAIAIIGLAGVIVGTIFLIKRIKHGPKKKRES